MSSHSVDDLNGFDYDPQRTNQYLDDAEDFRGSGGYDLSRSSRYSSAHQPDHIGTVTKKKKVAPQLGDPRVILVLAAVAMGGLVPFVLELCRNSSDEYTSSDEYITAMVMNMAGDFLTIMSLMFNFGQGQIRAMPEGEFPNFATIPIWVLHRTYATVDIIGLSTGFDRPYEGDDLKESSKEFMAAYEELAGTFPGDNWRGAAGDAYAEQVRAVRTMLKTMADTDADMHRELKDQAKWVTSVRLGFGLLKLIIAAAIVAETIALECGMTGCYSGEWTQWFYYMAKYLSRGGLVVAGLLVGVLACESDSRVSDITRCECAYTYAGKGVVQSDASAQAHVITTAETSVGGFETIAASMSQLSAGGGTLAEQWASGGGLGGSSGAPAVVNVGGAAMSTPSITTAAPLRPPAMFQPAPRPSGRPVDATRAGTGQPSAAAPDLSGDVDGAQAGEQTGLRSPSEFVVAATASAQEDSTIEG